MVANKSPLSQAKPVKKVPEYLIYEIMDGKPIYYKGYRDVIAGKKTFEEVMGSSTLQSIIITYLVILLGKKLDDNLYTILTNEAGLHLNKSNNLAGDILIFEATDLSVAECDEFYASIPPKIAIEVDITADVENMTHEGYMYRKTEKLLDFGVEKVIWITTLSKKVLIATKNSDWTVKDWDKEVEILPNVSFNLGQYLKDKGSKFA